MTSNRKILSLRPSKPAEALANAETVVKHGMMHLLCVRGTYNRGEVILAPHILYARHGEPYLDAIVIERDGARPTEMKLASFKLAGLRGVVITSDPFGPLPAFDPSDARYAEEVVARIDR